MILLWQLKNSQGKNIQMFDNCKLKRTYTTTEEDVTNDLNIPLLSGAVRYDRVVGFFSSSWLKEVRLV